MKGIIKYLPYITATMLIALIFTLSVTLVQCTIDSIIFSNISKSFVYFTSYRGIMLVELITTVIALNALSINYKRNPSSKFNDLLPRGIAEVID